MPYVKLDTGILESTLWIDREAREVFITALLMAEPYEVTEEIQALKVRSLEQSGFSLPPGWYGFVPAAGVGIVRRSGLQSDIGMDALERLGSPDHESRTPKWEGRRMVRIPHGYVVLNYMDYRDRDHTAADRQRRLRERKKAASSNASNAVTSLSNAVTSRDSNVTSRIADADADADAEKTKSKSASRADASPAFEPGTVLNLNRDAWKLWTEHRVAKKKPIKPHSMQIAAEELASLGTDQMAEVRRAIAGDWQGLHPPEKLNGAKSEREQRRIVP